MQHNAGKWVFMLALVGTSAWACGDDDDDVPRGMAGSGGKSEGGKGGTAGSAGRGGIGGAIAGAGGGGAGSCEAGAEGCPEVDACGPFPLSELCDARPAACPNLDELDVTQYCDEETTVTSRELSCGGQVIVVGYGLGAGTWGFDANGTLKYKRVDSDVIDTCPNDQAVSASTVWGELPCSATGPETSLCDAGGAGGGGGGGAGGAGGEGGRSIAN